jgi:RNase P protein component
MEGFDIVITPRPVAARASFGQLRADLELMLSRARLLVKERP